MEQPTLINNILTSNNVNQISIRLSFKWFDAVINKLHYRRKNLNSNPRIDIIKKTLNYSLPNPNRTNLHLDHHTNRLEKPTVH